MKTRLIRMKVKEVKDHPYPWNNEPSKEDAKPDLRNKKNPTDLFWAVYNLLGIAFTYYC